jgi:GNAT superfamily N-acetyltransferase
MARRSEVHTRLVNNSRVPSVSVRPVSGRGDFARFINHPYERHKADPHWVPPLRWGERERLMPTKNPFFAHAEVALFLACRGDRVTGRIGAIDDRLHLDTHRDNTALFGFFEASDRDTAAALLNAAEAWARDRGRVRVRGPINPSLNDNAGLLVDGFDSDPTILMPHNPPGYADFIEASGYRKAKDLFAWIYDVDRDPPQTMARLADRLRARVGVAIRPFRVTEFAAEAARLRELYNAAWERNWGFTAPTPEEFARLAQEMKPIFDPRIAVCAEHNGRMIACVIAIPDINQALKGTGGTLFPTGLLHLLRRKRYINQARVMLVGIDPGFRRAGLYPLLMLELHRQALAAGYKRLEFSWTLEDNRDVNGPAEEAGARRYKTYRIYEKALAP